MKLLKPLIAIALDRTILGFFLGVAFTAYVIKWYGMYLQS